MEIYLTIETEKNSFKEGFWDKYDETEMFLCLRGLVLLNLLNLRHFQHLSELLMAHLSKL